MRKWLALASLLLTGASTDWRAGPPPDDCPTTGTVVMKFAPKEETASLCRILTKVEGATGCYVPGTKTIYLPDPSELSANKLRSMLRHEMCHHNGGKHS